MDDSKRQLTLYLLLGILVAGSMYMFDSGPSTGSRSDHGTAATSAVTNGMTEAQRLARSRAQHRVSIRTPEISAIFTDRNASLVSLQLLEPRFAISYGGRPPVPQNLVSTDREEYLPMRQTIGGVTIPPDATWRAEQVTPTEVRFSWEGDGFRVVRTVRAGRAKYTLESDTTITSLSRGARPVRVREHLARWVKRDAEGGGMFGGRSPALTQGLCNVGDEVTFEDRSKLEDPRGLRGPVRYAGWGTNYFVTAVAPADGRGDRCVIGATSLPDEESAVGSVVLTEVWHPRRSLAPGASTSFRSVVYAGPKDPAALTAAGHDFAGTVDLGFFGFIAKGMVWLLETIFGYVGNWGIAIILLTFLVRIGLYPLTAASFKSMAKMRMLKPELDRIQEQFGDDQEKKGAAMMALYKTHSINPFAGCLPALAQMPIWLALYTSLSTNIELYHAPFLAWRDLSSPDPFFVLPAALAALMFVQQKMTPTTMDPVQAKIMLYMMPAMMGAFMLFLPAGLCFYMLTNSSLGIVQQKFVQWRLDSMSGSAANSTPVVEVVDVKPTSSSSSGKKGSKRGRA